jgi:hypothetical protein
MLAHLRAVPWRLDQDAFKAWRQGLTGYPLVDAGRVQGSGLSLLCYKVLGLSLLCYKVWDRWRASARGCWTRTPSRPGGRG